MPETDPQQENVVKEVSGVASWFSSAYMNASFIGNTPVPQAGQYESGESSTEKFTNFTNMYQGGVAKDGYNTSSETTVDSYANEEYCPLYWTPPPVKLLKTHDKTNLIYFTDETFYQNTKITLVRDIITNNTYSVSGDNTNQGDSMLWCSSSRSFDTFYVNGPTLGDNLPNKEDGLKQNPYLLPVFFLFNETTLCYQTSVLQFDVSYDDDAKMADLTFWANEFIDPYYTDERDPLYASNNRNALFYSKGSYKAIEVKAGKNKLLVDTIIFSYPVRVFSGNLGLSTNIINEEKFV